MACKRSAVRSRLPPPIDNPKQSSNIQRTGVTAGFLLPFASITEPAEVGELLRAIDGFRGAFVVQCALRLAPLFFVRPGDLRKAEWAQFNLDKAEWRYITSKTKTEHLVLMATQSVYVLHAFTNKTQQTPKKDIDLASQRYRELVNEKS